MRETLITVFFHLYLKAIKKQHSRWGPGIISLAHQEAGVFLLLPSLAHGSFLREKEACKLSTYPANSMED